jgi:hypothetical protein
MMKMYSAESSIHVKASTRSAGWRIYLVPIKRCSQTVKEKVKKKKKRERARKQTHTHGSSCFVHGDAISTYTEDFLF